MPLSFATDLLAWYEQHARQLPWRGHPDPYAVWVSEIMLQQTRVETVIPYFEQWMKRFPSIADLASASQQEVLSMWEGLGYYSRARTLQRGRRPALATGRREPAGRPRGRLQPGADGSGGDHLHAASARLP
ncbi:MAG: hypothetical protein P8Y14_28220 [Anaerolineales bacterium]